MLKWFVNNRPPSSHGEVVTDDPLATINVSKLSSEIYAVSRVNPLFKDETDKHKGSGKRSRPQSRNSRQSGSPYHSSSGYSSGTEEINGQRVYIGVKKDQKPVTEFRDDALIVLEQNIEFVKSILVAVRGSSPPSPTKKHRRRASGPSPATLTPIPEGKVDYSIPRPVWPKDDLVEGHIHQLSETDRSLIIPPDFQPDSIVDEALLAYTNHSYTPSSSSEQLSSGLRVPSVLPCQAVEHIAQQVTTVGTLNELSETLYRAIENHQDSYPETILKGLSEAASKNLDITRDSNPSDSSEEALRNLSFSLSQNGRINIMSRGFSNSSSSSGNSTRILRDSSSVRELDQSNANINELWQHHSTEHLNLPPAIPIRESDDDTQPRGTSSSSAASSSGFSDLIQTPRSTSSSGSPSSRRSEGLVQPPVFVHDDLTSVPNSVRNAMIYGTLCRINSKNIGNAYEKLLNSGSVRNISAGVGILDKESATNEDVSWQTYSGAEVTKGDVRLKSKGEPFCYPSPERPDFTMDVPRAERLLRKIQASKRRRCWCRLITSLLGLVFFLLSVMVVSMMVTRGQRIFGSL